MTVAEELERLQALRDRGSLSEAEHAQAKARVLGTASAPVHSGFLHRLSLSSTDRVIGGVCGGLGAHTGLPSWAWRVIFCISVLYFGIGLVFYVLLWIFIPADKAAAAPPGGAAPPAPPGTA
jgi:phage shock protein PspC (stress-responsive transcriptional regulator)